MGLCHLTVRPWGSSIDRDHGRGCWWAHTQQVLREKPLKDGRRSLRRAESWEAGHGQAIQGLTPNPALVGLMA